MLFKILPHSAGYSINSPIFALQKLDKLLMDKLIYVIPAMGIVGLLYTFVKFAWVSKQDAGNRRMKEISTYIAEGAMAFLQAEYKILTYFVLIGALLLGVMGLVMKTVIGVLHWLLF
jgi:Na+/H+-translocating membrane pyrophosphatase